MGRIVDLCGEIAASAEEGPEGLILPPDVWERLRADWDDEDIEDALGLVHDSLLQAELVESADSLSARLVEVLGVLGEPAAFEKVEANAAVIPFEVVGQLARRVARLEEVLDAYYREGARPDRRAFEELQRRLADHGIEKEMAEDWEAEEAEARVDGPAGRRLRRDDEEED
jgi:hypothetical protein